MTAAELDGGLPAEGEVPNELSVVADRRKSLVAAKVRLQEARAEHAKYANVFFKEGHESIRAAGQSTQLVSSKKWYNFWEKASRVPKVLVPSGGVEAPWSEVAEKAMDEVRMLAAADAEGFAAASSKNGASVQFNTKHVSGGVPLVRVVKDIPVDPKVLLLTQIRAPLLGETDPSVLYMREHYAFRGGKTTLFHKVNKLGPGMVAPRDVALFQTWDMDADGTITLAARSVDGSLPAKAVPGAVRGSVLLFGMQIKPKTLSKPSSFFSFDKTPTEVEGAEVTIISHSVMKGFVPTFLAKGYMLQEVFGYLNSVEITAAALEKQGDKEEQIKRFVLYPNGDEEEEEEENEEEQEQAAENAQDEAKEE